MATLPGPVTTMATTPSIPLKRAPGQEMSSPGRSVGGHRLGALVLLIVGIGMVAVALPNTAAYTAMGVGDGVLIRLKRGTSPPPRSIQAAIATRDAALGWMNFSQPLADKAALYFDLATRASAPSKESPGDPSDVGNSLLDRSLILHRKALGLGPARPYSWLRLAQAQYLRDPVAQNLNQLLRLSYLTAPAEPQLALQRVRLVYAARNLIEDDIREQAARDIRLVVRFRPGFLSEFARERFALPWLRERLRSHPDLEARFIGDYLKLPSP